LGRRLKQRLPRLRLVLEGPGVRDDAGVELFRAVPAIDGVALDDDDARLVALLRALYARTPPQGLVGALLRQGDEVHGAPRERPSADLPAPAQPHEQPHADHEAAAP